MPARSSWTVRLCVCLVSAAGLAATSFAAPPTPVAQTEHARRLWGQGQAAMRVGQVEKAIEFYHQCLAADPGMVRTYLSLAAAYLEIDRPDGASVHLGTYLHFCPEHLTVRAHYAELLMKLDKLPEARDQFERFADDSPARDANDLKQLIHCHSRLMEIAEVEEDEYGQHLHRGIGLFLLAKHRGSAGTAGDETPPEGLLCKAAAELTRARLERPDQARPSWYLYQVWSRLGRRQPALRHLRDADDAAPFSALTPAEQTALALACRKEHDRGLRR
jgi:tetratricopeptide (TPR) repeat protein